MEMSGRSGQGREAECCGPPGWRWVAEIRAVLGVGENWTDLGSLGLGVRITGWMWHGEGVLGSKLYGLRYR